MLLLGNISGVGWAHLGEGGGRGTRWCTFEPRLFRGGERCWCSMLAHARNHGFLWHVQPRGVYNNNEARWFILWQINRKACRSQASDSHDEPPFSGTGALARMRVVMAHGHVRKYGEYPDPWGITHVIQQLVQDPISSPSKSLGGYGLP